MKYDKAQTQYLVAKWSVLVLALCLLLPVIGLMAFSFPFSDDFANATWIKKDGVIDANLACYMGWSGRYFSNIMLGVANPLSYTNDLNDVVWIYRLHSIILLLLLFVSVYLFYKRFIPGQNGIGLLTISSIALGIASLGNGFEWLYWLSGSYTYCLGFCFCLLSIIFLSENQFNQNLNTHLFSRTLITGVILILILF